MDQDDKEDELLKMINDTQKESMEEKNHESIPEEEKQEQDDNYSHFFSNVFLNKTINNEKSAKSKSQSGLSVKSQPFGQSKQSVSHHNAWPGRSNGFPQAPLQAGNSFYKQQPMTNFQNQGYNTNLSKSGPPNSFGQLPVNNGKYKTKLTSATIIPKQGTGLGGQNNSLSPFQTTNNLPANFGSYQHLPNNRAETMQTSLFPSRSPTAQPYDHQPNQSFSPNGMQSVDNTTYDNLVDLIEKDIKVRN